MMDEKIDVSELGVHTLRNGERLLLSRHHKILETYSSVEGNQILRFAATTDWLRLFDALPDVYLFVKDRESRFVHVNQALLRRLGMKTACEIVGTTDADRYPAEAAAALVADDRAVMSADAGITGKVEALLNEQGLLDWYVTDKHPLHDDHGGVIGIVGIVRPYESKRRLGETDPQLDKIILYVREHPGFPHRVAELAKRANLSPRQLHRRFRHTVGMSVQDFVNRTRIQASSADLLRSDAGIAAIAAKYGFCNHAGYSRMFRKFTGMSPLQFRRRHQRVGHSDICPDD